MILIRKIKLYLLFMFFTLIHELSHMIMGAILGLKPEKITIMPFGFKITFKEYETQKVRKKILTEISGPLINLIILFMALKQKLSSDIIYTNLLLAGFNIIPIYPLDGGRIIKSILESKLSMQKAYEIINKISNITVIILTVLTSIMILYVKNIFMAIILAYLWYIVIRENRVYKYFKIAYKNIRNGKREPSPFPRKK